MRVLILLLSVFVAGGCSSRLGDSFLVRDFSKRPRVPDFGPPLDQILREPAYTMLSATESFIRTSTDPWAPNYAPDTLMAGALWVPSPEKTPYDQDPVALTCYLEAYHASYRYHLAGGVMSISFASDLPSRAADAGWRDGAKAGKKRRAARRSSFVEPPDGPGAASDSGSREE